MLEEFKEKKETLSEERRSLWREFKEWLCGKKRDKEARRQGYRVLEG